MTPHRPSRALKFLQFLVQKRIIRRGQSWILKIFPDSLWGGSSLLIDTEIGPICVPVSERSASCLICEGSIQETRESRLISKLVLGFKVVIDIGSHMGWYARLMANANPKLQVFAFEPDPENFSYVECNLQDTSNSKCFMSGVGETDGSGSLWKGRTCDLHSTARGKGSSIPVDIVSLDSFCKEQKLKEVDFIKCDVEGAELFVLKGAKEIFASERPPVWMLEIAETFMGEAGYSSADILSFFKESDHSYKMFTQDIDGVPVEIKNLEDRKIGNNVFFVPDCHQASFEKAGSFLQA